MHANNSLAWCSSSMVVRTWSHYHWHMSSGSRVYYTQKRVNKPSGLHYCFNYTLLMPRSCLYISCQNLCEFCCDDNSGFYWSRVVSLGMAYRYLLASPSELSANPRCTGGLADSGGKNGISIEIKFCNRLFFVCFPLLKAFVQSATDADVALDVLCINRLRPKDMKLLLRSHWQRHRT